MRLGRTLNILLFLMLTSLLMGGSSLPPGDKTERVRAFTRDIEFDYVAWTLDRLAIKPGQVATAGHADYLTRNRRNASRCWITWTW
jgi:hypothetical protein